MSVSTLATDWDSLHGLHDEYVVPNRNEIRIQVHTAIKTPAKIFPIERRSSFPANSLLIVSVSFKAVTFSNQTFIFCLDSRESYLRNIKNSSRRCQLTLKQWLNTPNLVVRSIFGYD